MAGHIWQIKELEIGILDIDTGISGKVKESQAKLGKFKQTKI